jgi:hypothetical protein
MDSQFHVLCGVVFNRMPLEISEDLLELGQGFAQL